MKTTFHAFLILTIIGLGPVSITGCDKPTLPDPDSEPNTPAKFVDRSTGDDAGSETTMQIPEGYDPNTPLDFTVYDAEGNARRIDPQGNLVGNFSVGSSVDVPVP